MSEARVAIVTGASSGIGAATAVALANAGCRVLLTFSGNREGGEATAESCCKAGVEAEAIRADIARDTDCRRIAAEATRRWGRIDILVNNAGTTRFGDPYDLESLTAEDFERIFAVNVTGSYQVTRAASPQLREQRGAVVNISSHSGFSGIGSSIAYAASKGALNTLTLGLARSLAPEVRVNAVCPGFVDTEWMAPKVGRQELPAFKRRIAELAPLRRVVSPEEVAEAVCWFALGGHSITGQLLVIDGGTHLTVGAPV